MPRRGLATGHGHPVARGLREMPSEGFDARPQLVTRRNNQLGRCGRRGRPQVGDEISDGNVGLVPDGRNHRHRAGHYGARHSFLVERPKILERAAATRHDDKFRPPRPAEKFEAAADFLRRPIALHERGKEPDVQPGETALQDLQHVGDHRPARRSHNADAPWKARQRPLARGLEEALGREFLLELLERELQSAVSLRLEKLDQQLIFATRFENIDAPTRQHRHAVLRFEFQIPVRRPETDAAQLRVPFFEREIVMPARGQFGPRDFPHDPDVLKLAVQYPANSGVQLTNCEDPPLGKKL